MTKQHKFTNRLIKEKSPYLLQHAHNPVDWYPWGEEAFRAAKELDRPIFLSIGYSTCHWCHAMEHESFENEEVAQLLNDAFINIKVDREELPEVDNIYMEFAQSMMAGSAGWPLNLLLTPELKPFFATTYLPPHSRHGLVGLVDLINRIHDTWIIPEERERITSQADKIVEIFEENIQPVGDLIPNQQEIEDTAELMFKIADPVYGGLKGAPKFPIGYQTNFMIRYSTLMNDSRALFLVEKTLDMMHRGGIYDHLGGGFSRYSVDEEWLVPHFEKMLYDNALLASAYLEAWQATKNPLYKEICEDILKYVLHDMKHTLGGFYSAEDADSEGTEGWFYTWTYEEVMHVLGENGKIFAEFFDITPHGNFDTRNILHTPQRIEEFANQRKLDPQKLLETIKIQRETLRKVRETRVRPFCDDKILVSWNGLMINTLAEAGAAFGNQSYFEAAKNAANFIKINLYKEGHLLRRWRDGEALYNGGLDEYAFLIKGLLTLFETHNGTEWLDWALDLTEILTNEFKANNGAFFQTDGKDENFILRKCLFSDGAEPSGNAIHCENLMRLYQLTEDHRYWEEAEDILKAVKKYMDNYAPGYCYHLIDLMRYYDPHLATIVIALNEKKQFQDEILHYIWQNLIPHKAIIWREVNDQQLFELIPFARQQPPIEGKTTVYICHEGFCEKPLVELSEIIEALHKL